MLSRFDKSEIKINSNVEKNERQINHAVLNLPEIKKKLNQLKYPFAFNSSEVSVFFPNENNQLEEFHIYKNSVLSNELEIKYPHIKTFIGYSNSRSNVKIRGSFTDNGLNGMIVLPEEIIYIQPIKNSSQGEHIYYKNKNELYNSYSRLICLSENKSQFKFSYNNTIQKQKKIIELDRKISVFKIAVSATASYTEFWGDNNNDNGSNKQDAYAAVVSTINRVNEVFETDLGIRLELVSNDSLIYDNQLNQPYRSNLSNELQETLSKNIGESNYDIGHLFAYSNIPDGESGCIGCVCVDGQKGRAYSTHPFIDFSGGGIFLNDYFDIDFVAHEIGHQFGAHHTFSYENEGTGVNVEPGSGSTIMGYAGITGENDLQDHSDPYFHYLSIKEISSVLEVKNCQNIEDNSNFSPQVFAGNNTFIPVGTAYMLTASATDTDSVSMTFTWEQLDDGRVNNSNFSSNLISGSLNRSFPPSISPIRYVPNLNRILEGNLTQVDPSKNSQWESVSTIARAIKWGITVRDKIIGTGNYSGQIAQDQIKINVVESSKPFKVTSQNSLTELWGSGSIEKITWDVGDTFESPINTKTVSIFLSVDGGNSFPIKLLSKTANDGEEYIFVPDSIATSKARIKITADNSIYFAINASNFQIELRDFSFELEKPEFQFCDINQKTISFKYKSYYQFNDEVEFEILGIPQGLTYEISPKKTALNDTEIKIQFNNIENLINGNLNLKLVGTSSSLISNTTNIKIEKRSSNILSPSTINPLNNSVNESLSTTLNWTQIDGADKYQIQLSDFDDFRSFILNKETNLNSISINNLKSQTNYFWRVKAINNCVETDFSDTSKFKTELISCKNFISENSPVNLQDADSNNFGITYDEIKIPYDLKIEDLNVTLSINHTYLSDLDITLISPSGKEVALVRNIGGNKSNFVETTFDDETEFYITEGLSPYSGIYKPFEKLSLFKGDSSFGTWRLRVVDSQTEDSGQLTSFKLNFCLRGELFPNNDFDSIANESDNCPNVTNEDQSDSNQNGIGDLCDFYDPLNFEISKVNETCSEKNNGKISIKARAKFDYLVKLTGPNSYFSTDSFSDEIYQAENLNSGEYLICITIASSTTFEKCFRAIISEPQELKVQSSVNLKKELVSLNLSGADTYDIYINKKKIKFSDSKISLNLRKGLNTLKIKTDIECQGTYEKNIYLDSSSIIYPNPVDDNLTILVGGERTEFEIFIFNLQGNFIKNKTIKKIESSRKIRISTNELTTGSYILKIDHFDKKESIKFIKK